MYVDTRIFGYLCVTACCMYLHVYTSMHMCECVHVSGRHMCTGASVHALTSVLPMFTRMYVIMQICRYVYLYTCFHVCFVDVYMYPSTYVRGR